jgi:S-adenosylmethionine-diacylgycerolhomoserine-N-methlytransferase
MKLKQPDVRFASMTSIERYYQIHARIYDLTRWIYLFGRKNIVNRLSDFVSPKRILEVGCGTGKNLVALSEVFPSAEIVGIDISSAMLAVARKKTQGTGSRIFLQQMSYDRPLCPSRPFDCILFSYCLSMMNPGWQRAIKLALSELNTNGFIGVVDFHESPLRILRVWGRLNYVRFDGHLLPYLSALARPTIAERRAAFLGLWEYFIFVGEKVFPG